MFDTWLHPSQHACLVLRAFLFWLLFLSSFFSSICSHFSPLLYILFPRGYFLQSICVAWWHTILQAISRHLLVQWHEQGESMLSDEHDIEWIDLDTTFMDWNDLDSSEVEIHMTVGPLFTIGSIYMGKKLMLSNSWEIMFLDNCTDQIYQYLIISILRPKLDSRTHPHH